MKTNRFTPRLCTGFLFGTLAFANVATAQGIAVIVNSNNSTTSLTEKEIENIFLVKTESFPNGKNVTPADQPEGDNERMLFYSSITQRTAMQLQKYWAREMFSGNALPPEVIGDEDAIIQWVMKNADGIGYVRADAIGENDVKVVYTITP